MVDVVTLNGSPSARSRSSAVLAYARNVLEQQGLITEAIEVRDLPAEDLLFARVDSSPIHRAATLIHHANAVVVATPIYKASYSGLLKVFLDLLPQRALRGKVVLPIATGGSLAHCLALDYALHPVLATLGATTVLHGVYLVDQQIQISDNQLLFDAPAQQRLDDALETLLETVAKTHQAPVA